MNSYERFLRAMELQEPDILPIFPTGICANISEKILGRVVVYRNPKLYLELCERGKIKEANEKVAQDQIDIAEKMNFDCVRDTNQLGAWFTDPAWEYMPSDAKVKKISEKEWEINGVKVLYSEDIMSLYTPTPIVPSDEDKAKELLREKIANIEVPEEEYLSIRRIAKAVKGKRFIIGVIQGTFVPFYGGFENLLVWMRTNPSLYRLWSEYYLKVNIERAKLKIEAGADAIFENDDYATNVSPMISPQLFKEFVVPNLKKLRDETHKKGAFFIKHTDGNINMILKDIVDAKIDALHSIEINAGMDIGKVKDQFGDKICLLGNIDQARTLTQPNQEKVVKDTLECIEKASYGGGHVMTTSNNLTPEVVFDSLLTWIKATRKYGLYPKLSC